MPVARSYVRALTVCLCAAAAAGCSGGDDAGAPLFTDDFTAGTFPAPLWVGEGIVSTTTGAPAPSMFLAASPPIVTGTVQMANPVDLSGGTTVRFDAANAAGGAFSDVNLFDVNANDVLAYIAFRPDQVRLYITGDTGTVLAITPDTAFHAYELTISSSGATRWTRDGVTQLEGQLSLTPSLGRLLIRADANGVFLDNIEIR